VLEERLRILHPNETNNDILQAKNLTKCFRRATGQSLLAVDHLCFGISKGQCFGLLGINGAVRKSFFLLRKILNDFFFFTRVKQQHLK
jgi:ABC-type Na+ transport system ATPase subunit NatA